MLHKKTEKKRKRKETVRVDIQKNILHSSIEINSNHTNQTSPVPDKMPKAINHSSHSSHSSCARVHEPIAGSMDNDVAGR